MDYEVIMSSFASLCKPVEWLKNKVVTLSTISTPTPFSPSFCTGCIPLTMTTYLTRRTLGCWVYCDRLRWQSIMALKSWQQALKPAWSRRLSVNSRQCTGSEAVKVPLPTGPTNNLKRTTNWGSGLKIHEFRWNASFSSHSQKFHVEDDTNNKNAVSEYKEYLQVTSK